MTLHEREWKERSDKLDKHFDELIQSKVDNMTVHDDDVPEMLVEDITKKILRKDTKKPQGKPSSAKVSSEMRKPAINPLKNKGSATITAKNAAAALSQPQKTSTAPLQKSSSSTSTKSRIPSSLLASKKKTPTPTNPSTMRHTAAVTASKTTMGYSKGRATSYTMKNSILPKDGVTKSASAGRPDTTLAPAMYIHRYGIPPVGSEMWLRCLNSGCFDDDEGDLDDAIKGITPGSVFEDDEAESDFQFTL